MIAVSVAYDLVFVVHLLAAVATLIVLVVMRATAVAVTRGADSATQQVRLPERRNWAARVFHLVPVTGLIMSLSGGHSVAPSRPWVIVGMLCYLAGAGHLEARTLPLEREITDEVHRAGSASPEKGRQLTRSVDVLLGIVAVAFISMLVQF